MAGQGVPGDPNAPGVEGLVRALAAAVLGHSQGQDKASSWRRIGLGGVSGAQDFLGRQKKGKNCLGSWI